MVVKSARLLCYMFLLAECTFPLGTWNFRNFKAEFLLNGKSPKRLILIAHKLIISVPGMDPLWTLRREISFLLSDLLSSNVSSSGKSFGSRSDITHHTWSRVTKKSYFRLIFLCMPPSLACEYSRFSLLLTRTLRHVPSGEEQGETAVFAGYNFLGLLIPFWQPL